MVHPFKQEVVALDQREAKEIAAAYRSDPLINMCRALVLDSLLSGGISIECNGKPSNLAFQQHVDTHWMRCARDVFDNFLMFGFAPWLPVNEEVEGSRGGVTIPRIIIGPSQLR